MSAQLALSFERRRPKVSYWPTTPMPLDQLAAAIRLAELQDEAVLAIYRSHHLIALTPSQVHRIGNANGCAWLLTSVRRSITNLTANTGPLQRLNDTRPGPHGRPESCWSLRRAA
jgi:ABC-type Zn2+ transport system substrate-binding protein/surface adhesin